MAQLIGKGEPGLRRGGVLFTGSRETPAENYSCRKRTDGDAERREKEKRGAGLSFPSWKKRQTTTGGKRGRAPKSDGRRAKTDRERGVVLVKKNAPFSRHEEALERAG